MSTLELSRLFPIGQYWPTGSRIHRLDPRARLLGGLLLLGGITVAQRLTGLALAWLVLALLYRLARVPLREGARALGPTWPFLALLAVLQVFFNVRVDTAPVWVTLGRWQLSPADLEAAALLVMRFVALMLALNLLTFCLADTELVRALETLARPLRGVAPVHDAVLLVQVTLHFIPLMLRELERIAKAQASRGAEWGATRGGPLRRARLLLPLLVPLFLNGLQRSENLALAMEARGYDGRQPRTSWVELRWRAADSVALLIALGLALGIGR